MLKKRKKMISIALALVMVFSMKIGCLAEPVSESAVEAAESDLLSVKEAAEESVGEATEELPITGEDGADLPEEGAEDLKEAAEPAELPEEIGVPAEEVPVGAAKLDTPQNVRIVSANGTVSGDIPVKPGYIVFDKVAGTLLYSVEVQYVNASSSRVYDVHVPDDNPGKAVFEDFTYENFLPTSPLQVRAVVQAKGDGISYTDSDKAESEVWTYTQPNSRLASPVVTITASDYTISWTKVDLADRFRVGLIFTGGAPDDSQYFVASPVLNALGKYEYRIFPELIEEKRQQGFTGLTVEVYALSDDITVICPGNIDARHSIPLDRFPAYDPNALRSISFKENPIRIGVRKSVSMGVVFNPENATDKRVTYESLNPSVAWVDSNGNVVGSSVGSTWITVKSAANPRITASCNVIVSEFSPDSVSGGSIGKWGRWELESNGTLVVECSGKSLSAATPPWKEYLDQITSLELRGAIMSVKTSLFHNMPVLASVTLPYSMGMRIKNNTGLFYNCPMLEKIGISGGSDGTWDVISDNLIVQEQKRGKTVLIGLKTATEIPSEIQTIGARAFYGQALPYIKLPSNVSRVEANAFAGCKQLSFVVIGNTKCTIMGNAFADCSNLTDVYFAGTDKEWKRICKDKVLKAASVHYGSSMPELCKVTFDTTGGNPVSDQVVIKGRTIAELPVCYHSGNKVLDGWYLDSGCTQPFVEKSTRVEDNTTLYAKWRDAVPYKVVFYSGKNADGSWIKLSEQTVYEQKYVSVPTMKGEGEESFVGWYSDEKLVHGFNTRNRITSDVNLYARWTKLTVERKTGMLTDEVEMAYELEYTKETEYDGRSHVVKEVAGKTTVSSASVNPDIEAMNFRVIVNGQVVPGITVSKFTYENNKLPSNDGMTVKPMMYIYPVVKYDKNDSDLKELLRQYPNFKTVLQKMLKPAYDKKAGEWNYEPLTVEIKRIELSSGTEVYTKAQLKADQELKTKDGVLVWNGGKVKYTYKTVGRGEDAEKYLLKKTVPGLYYQRAFRLSNGKTVVKKLTLRVGGWSMVTRRDEDGEIERYFKMNCKNFDYYVEEGGDSLALNSSPWVTENDNGEEICRIRAGYFEGDLPSIESEEPAT